MTSQDKISIAVTFVFGLLAGSYVYVTGFATTFNPPEAAPEAIYSGLIIRGEGYGECEQSNTCLAFQVLENGDYRALFDDAGDGNSAAKEGSIPRALRNQLRAALVTEALVADSKIRNTSDCKYGSEGTNYKFQITLDRQDYVLDTCQTTIDYDGSVWASLTQLWNYFTTLKI